MMKSNGVVHVIRPIIGAVVVSSIVAFMFLGALHSPEPQEIDVALAGPDAATRPLGERLMTKAPDAFELHYFESVEDAREGILTRDYAAALDVSETEPRLLIASAGGALGTNVLRSMFEGAAAESGQTMQVEDLVPLHDGDRAGLSPFLTTMATVLPALILAALIAVTAAGLPVTSKLISLTMGTGLIGLTSALFADPIFGALTDNFWGVFGAAWLLALSVSAAGLALHRLVRGPGIALAALMFVVFGLPVSGAAVGPDFIPEGFGAFALAFPTGEAASLLRSIAYFPDASIGLELTLLASWSAVAVLVMLIPERNRLRPVKNEPSADGDR